MKNTAAHTSYNPGVKKHPPLHILLAEDNLLNIKLACLLFTQNGLTFQVAENGRIAVEKIRNNHFDIVLMDMEMPVMNGYQATDLIRHELKNSIPIIAMTAHTGRDEREKCLQLGMNDHIAKPFDESRLLRSILHLTRSKIPAAEIKYTGGSKRTAANPRRVCNFDYLNKVTRGNKKSLNSILDILLKETPEKLSILDEAIEKTNYVLIGDICHKIRTSFSILGIPVLIRISKEMEQLSCLASGMERINKLNYRVHRFFVKVIEELKAETGKA